MLHNINQLHSYGERAYRESLSDAGTLRQASSSHRLATVLSQGESGRYSEDLERDLATIAAAVPALGHSSRICRSESAAPHRAHRDSSEIPPAHAGAYR